MSKFKLRDHVRVTATEHRKFDQVGVVLYASRIARAWKYCVQFGTETAAIWEHELTLADPDVHTVLDQMDAEGAPDTRGMVDVNRRAQVLRTAESLVNGQRADDYGPPAENFGRVAAMWSAQFAAKLKEQLTADEVAIALVHLKLSRLANTPGHEDSFVDAAGYIALAAEIAEAAQ